MAARRDTRLVMDDRLSLGLSAQSLLPTLETTVLMSPTAHSRGDPGGVISITTTAAGPAPPAAANVAAFSPEVAFVQGLLTAVVSLVLYGRAVSILGALGGATSPALVPVMVVVLGTPVLGEWPDWIDWIAIILISTGVYVVSGGPLPRRPHPSVRPQT